LILIGSRAKNIAKTYSDFDLLIVYRDLKEEIYNTVRRLKSINLPVDLFLISVKTSIQTTNYSENYLNKK